MISEIFTRSTALSGIVVASALALAACNTARQDEASDGPSSATTEVAASETAAATSESATASASVDIIDTATAAGSFTTLIRVLDAAGLSDTLRGNGPFTVFAPNDEAFAALPPGTVDALLLPENRARLTQILSYHVVSGRELASGDFAGSTMTLDTVEGRTIDINGTNGVKVNNATVIAADVDASNGVIHVIDTVLIP